MEKELIYNVIFLNIIARPNFLSSSWAWGWRKLYSCQIVSSCLHFRCVEGYPNTYEELGGITTKRETGHREVHGAPLSTLLSQPSSCSPWWGASSRVGLGTVEWRWQAALWGGSEFRNQLWGAVSLTEQW